MFRNILKLVFMLFLTMPYYCLGWSVVVSQNCLTSSDDYHIDFIFH